MPPGRWSPTSSATARAVAAPGVTLGEIDAAAREILAKAGATSPFLNYHPRFAPVPYPAVICTSVNDAALHGIPDDYRLQDGDLLSVDAGATLDGWVGDAAVSFSVGDARRRRRRADHDHGERRWRPGSPPPGRAAGSATSRPRSAHVGRAGGYGISTDLGGHGVGRTMHEDPHIPNRGKAGRGLRLVPGLVVAIEPWFIAGGDDGIYLDEDGWTIRTADGSRAAHVEHTIAVTASGPVILTTRSANGRLPYPALSWLLAGDRVSRCRSALSDIRPHGSPASNIRAGQETIAVCDSTWNLRNAQLDNGTAWANGITKHTVIHAAPDNSKKRRAPGARAPGADGTGRVARRQPSW